MPHLIYGGRLWRFASDELSIPATCAVSSRCIWTVLLCIIIALTMQSIQECSGQGYYILGYLIASLSIQAINILCEIGIIRYSIQGTMVDSKPRARVSSFLSLHLYLSLLQFACAIYGILVVTNDFIPCNSVLTENSMSILLFVVVISQLVDLSGILCCATMFSSRSVDVSLNMDDPDVRPNSMGRQSRANSVVGPDAEDLVLWEKRCVSLCRRLQLVTCNLFGGAGVGEDLATVGRVFSNFFHHEGFLDVVPSDVVAGILLVRFQQRVAKLKSRKARIKSIEEQGVKFDLQTPSYGASKSSCILRVPSLRPVPDLHEARSIVVAAREGVVLRPFSQEIPRPLEIGASPSLDVASDLKEPKSSDVAYVMTTTASQRTFDKNGREVSVETASGGEGLKPALPSRYSPRRFDAATGKAVWNRSESDLSASSLPPTSAQPTLATRANSSHQSAATAPTSSKVKTRTSYFSALEVLERSYSSKQASSSTAAASLSEYSGSSSQLGQLEEDPHSSIGFTEFSDIARFSYFALAAYSTLVFLYMHPCKGCCSLGVYGCCHESVLSSCCRPDSSSPRKKASLKVHGKDGRAVHLGEHVEKTVEHDNLCHTHESAMRQMVKAPNTELVYAQFANDISTRPYAVFIDYEKEALVISIRGTLSLEDCVADAISEPESLEEAGRRYGFHGEGRHAHSGFLRSAMWIREDLCTHPQVARLLSAVAGAAPSGMTMDRENSTDSTSSGNPIALDTPLQPQSFSRLVIVGHSLGAGVASLLALLMKSEYPTLHCFGYGAPGSTMDAVTAHEAKSYVSSIILGDDMVGCLSFHSLASLREQTLDAIVRSRCSKMSILQMTMFKDSSEELLEELLYPPGQEPNSTFRSMFLKYKAHMQRQHSSFVPCRLHVPGKVVHLRQIGKERMQTSLIGSATRVLIPVVEPELNYFDEIKVSSTMITDHMPDKYVEELNAIHHDWAVERSRQRCAPDIEQPKPASDASNRV